MEQAGLAGSSAVSSNTSRNCSGSARSSDSSSSAATPLSARRAPDGTASTEPCSSPEGCSIVAHRPYAWRRATSASHFSTGPSDTIARPSSCTCRMSFVAFLREYPKSFWNTYTT